MRKLFSKFLYTEMVNNDSIILITADLGFGLWDDIKRDFPNRFYDVGAAEQLMVGMAVGMAMENKIPICYSITPFLLYRPFELIRNYLDHEMHAVKLVGGGRDKEYGYLGFTHWAEDDLSILNSFKDLKKYKPETENQLRIIFNEFIYNRKPSYLNLRK